VPGVEPREAEVLTLVAEGKSNKEIATALDLAENTVKNHLKNILGKLHLENASKPPLRPPPRTPGQTTQENG